MLYFKAKTRLSHCVKKSARFPFHFGVNTTDDDCKCKQHVPVVALRLQQLTTPAVRRRSAWLTAAVV